ncbi:HAD family hydrolase [Paenibacillus chibensis]|uniref:HAD family hydrolase n=1 Tax=Paenibacillus chibensis TaxID=59846 RepID=A0ABU6PR42_9BACL|nr:HAD family hydrolase [Paenibacillus chibensis]
MQLVLDLAGVLIGNLTPVFWEAVAARSNIQAGDIKKRFKRELRENLWTGRVGAQDFWTWLDDSYAGLERTELQSALQEALRPLPAWNRLKDWQRSADIHLLSNHCSEWVEPMLEEVKPFIKSVTISSEAGCCKPDLAIFRRAETFMPKRAQVVYVDDQEKNLIVGRILGWDTLLADVNHDWMNKIDQRFGQGIMDEFHHRRTT